MNTNATYDLMDGWQIEVEAVPDSLDELILRQVFNTGFRDVWRMQIPPKMPEEDLISQAKMLSTLYQTAWRRGVADALEEFKESIRYLLEDTGGTVWEDGGEE